MKEEDLIFYIQNHNALFRYKFRIKAENAYGISEESEESDPFDVGGVNNQETRYILYVWLKNIIGRDSCISVFMYILRRQT